MAQYWVKLAVIGDMAVGKTSLLLRFTEDVFSEHCTTNLSVDFMRKTTNIGQLRVKMTLWDTPGQSRYTPMVSSLYRASQALVVVFSLTDMDSFNHVTTWLQEADRYGKTDCVKLLVGNKCDLTTQRVVDKDTAQELADRLGMPYIETSAKKAINVDQSLTALAQRVVDMKDSTQPDLSKTSIQLSPRARLSSHLCCGGSKCSLL